MGTYHIENLAHFGDQAYSSDELGRIFAEISLDDLYEILKVNPGFKPAIDELTRRMSKWSLKELADVHSKYDNRVESIARIAREVAHRKISELKNDQCFFDSFLELVRCGNSLIAQELTGELTKRMSHKRVSWLIVEAKKGWHMWSDCALTALTTKTKLGTETIETLALAVAKNGCGFEVEKVALEWFKNHQYQLTAVAVEALLVKCQTKNLPDSRRFAEIIARWLPKATKEEQIRLLKNEQVFDAAMCSLPRTDLITMTMWSVENLTTFIEDDSNVWACGSAKDVLLKKLTKMPVAELQSLATQYEYDVLAGLAIEALAKRNTISANSIDLIASRVSSESEVVAMSAIQAVATAKLTQAKPDIIHALDVSKSEEVRMECLKAMVIFVGDQEVAIRLHNFIAICPPGLERHYATESLVAIGFAEMLRSLCEKS